MQHYYAGSQRVALRAGGEVSFVLSDHLGSPSTLVGVGGELQASRRYTAWGETRMASGASGLGVGYTGQEQAVGLGGLHDYGARWFDPLLGRFLSPDTLVPDPYNPLDWDRYGYARNNPVRYTDPTGHYVTSMDEGEGSCKNSLDCVYPEGHQQAGELIIPVTEKERKQGAQTLGTGLALVPGLDTGDDLLTLLTGCGYVCQLGGEGKAGISGRAISALALFLPISGSTIRKAATPITTLSVSQIRFTQDSISAATKGGVSLDALTQEIASGYFKGSIRVVEFEGNKWSLDNRRLAAFKLLGADAPIEYVDLVDPAILAEFHRKFTTITEGLSISVRGTGITIP